MKFSCFCQIVNILSATAQDFCGFGHIHNPVHNEILKVRNRQRNFCAGTIQCSRTNVNIDIPFDTMSSWLKIDSKKEIFVFEQHLKRRRIFIAIPNAAFLYASISEENQKRKII